MTSPKLPKASDLPAVFHPVIHPSPTIPLDQVSNIILFLPGLGDTSTNFSSFPHALNLPESLAITLQPPFPLPAPIGPGFSWSKPEDLVFDQSKGEIDAGESTTATAAQMLAKVVILDVLVGKCGWRLDNIHLFGFGMGGSVALKGPLAVQQQAAETALQSDSEGGSNNSNSSNSGLGSVMSIGGPLPLDTPLARSNSAKDKTPVLILGGSAGAVFGGGDQGGSSMKRLEDRYEFVQKAVWKKARNAMPSSREEVLPMMQFWGRRLKSRKGVPSDAVEVRLEEKWRREISNVNVAATF